MKCLTKLKAGTSKEAIGLGSFWKYRLPYFDVETPNEIKKLIVNSKEIKAEISSELTHQLTHQLTLVKKICQQLLQDAVQGKLVPQNKKDEPACVHKARSHCE